MPQMQTETQQAIAGPQFEGTAEQQELAARLFRIFAGRGRFFSDRAPIRLSLSQLAEFMQQQEPRTKDWTKRIDAALSASPAVFSRDEGDDEVVFATTRGGASPD